MSTPDSLSPSAPLHGVRAATPTPVESAHLLSPPESCPTALALPRRHLGWIVALLATFVVGPSVILNMSHRLGDKHCETLHNSSGVSCDVVACSSPAAIPTYLHQCWLAFAATMMTCHWKENRSLHETVPIGGCQPQVFFTVEDYLVAAERLCYVAVWLWLVIVHSAKQGLVPLAWKREMLVHQCLRLLVFLSPASLVVVSIISCVFKWRKLNGHPYYYVIVVGELVLTLIGYVLLLLLSPLKHNRRADGRASKVDALFVLNIGLAAMCFIQFIWDICYSHDLPHVEMKWSPFVHWLLASSAMWSPALATLLVLRTLYPSKDLWETNLLSEASTGDVVLDDVRLSLTVSA